MGKKNKKLKKKIDKIIQKSSDMFISSVDTAKFMKNTMNDIKTITERLDAIDCKTECPVNDCVIDIKGIDIGPAPGQIIAYDNTKYSDEQVVGHCIDQAFSGDRLLIVSENRPKAMVVDYATHNIDEIELVDDIEGQKAFFRKTIAEVVLNAAEDDRHKDIETYVDSYGDEYSLINGEKILTIDAEEVKPEIPCIDDKEKKTPTVVEGEEVKVKPITENKEKKESKPVKGDRSKKAK